MNVLVTGGSGFVGRAILDELARKGHRIALLVRNQYAPRTLSLAGAYPLEMREADLFSRGAVEAAMWDIDAVIHLVGIIAEVGRNTFENVHVQATQHLVLAAQSAHVPRFVHMSALGTRPQAVSRYHQTKWEAEEAVRRSGLRYTLFRPSLVYGPGDQFVNRFERMSRWSPFLPVLGPGTAMLQPVAVEEVARCFVQALAEPRSEGECFDLGGPALSFRRVLETILDVTGRRRWLVSLPLGLARPMARFFEFVFPRILRQPPPLNRDQIQMLQEDNVGDCRPAIDVLGLQQVPFRAGIARYLVGSSRPSPA